MVAGAVQSNSPIDVPLLAIGHLPGGDLQANCQWGHGEETLLLIFFLTSTTKSRMMTGPAKTTGARGLSWKHGETLVQSDRHLERVLEHSTRQREETLTFKHQILQIGIEANEDPKPSK